MKHYNSFQKVLKRSFITTTTFVLLDLLIHYFYKPLEIKTATYSYISNINPLFNYSIGKFIITFILLIILFYLFKNIKFRYEYLEYALPVLIIISVLEASYIIYHFSGWGWHIQNYINHYISLIIGVYVGKYFVKNVVI